MPKLVFFALVFANIFKLGQIKKMKNEQKIKEKWQIQT